MTERSAGAPSCPSCGARAVFWKIGVDSFYQVTSVEASYWDCQSCGLKFMWPVPSRHEISGFYPSGYWQETSHNGPLSRLESLYTGILLNLDLVALIKRVLPRHHKGKTCLDIGCSRGDFLDKIRRLGVEVKGLEGDPRAIAYARTRFDLEVEQMDLEDWEPDEVYDFISAFHVLEHVRDPLQLLHKIKTAMKPESLLYLRVPNVDSLQAHVLGSGWKGLEFPRHISHFSPRSLEFLLEKAGLRVIHVTTWALRDGPPALTSSLCRKGEPTWQMVHQRSNTLYKLCYLFLNWLLTPLEILAALLGKGSMLTVTCGITTDQTTPITRGKH